MTEHKREVGAKKECASDVPSPIDLRKMADAREWAVSAMEKRPWREDFFRVIAEQVGRMKSGNVSLLELGSGPGFLARHILETPSSVAYVALDFSSAMHTLAKERLGALADRVEFLELDFKGPDWSVGLPAYDIVVSVQAVHELRHKRHAPSLYRTVRSLLRDNGIFLICDHYVGQGGLSNTALYMTPEEHELALHSGGFTQVNELLRKGGIVLFRAAE